MTRWGILQKNADQQKNADLQKNVDFSVEVFETQPAVMDGPGESSKVSGRLSIGY